MVSLTPSLYLQPAIERLRAAVLQQNQPGSVEGLLAHHVMRDEPRAGLEWQVFCTQEWMNDHFRPTNLDHVAALGYSMWTRPVPSFMPQLTEGLSRISERDAFSGEHLSLARNPTRLLGVVLGCHAAGTHVSGIMSWCQGVLGEIKQRGIAKSDPLVPYLAFRACGEKIKARFSLEPSLYELAVTEWFTRHQMHEYDLSMQQMRDIRHRILFGAATDLRFESASQAAFIWSSIIATFLYALDEASLQPKHVVAVLQNLEAAMKRWRWDRGNMKKPICWPVAQEREVQDILWLVLRSYFPDVVDEDALPKLGHSTYRADFGIRSLKLIIEAKFASCR